MVPGREAPWLSLHNTNMAVSHCYVHQVVVRIIIWRIVYSELEFQAIHKPCEDIMCIGSVPEFFTFSAVSLKGQNRVRPEPDALYLYFGRSFIQK